MEEIKKIADLISYNKEVVEMMKENRLYSELQNKYLDIKERYKNEVNGEIAINIKGKSRFLEVCSKIFQKNLIAAEPSNGFRGKMFQINILNETGYEKLYYTEREIQSMDIAKIEKLSNPVIKNGEIVPIEELTSNYGTLYKKITEEVK